MRRCFRVHPRSSVPRCHGLRGNKASQPHQVRAASTTTGRRVRAIVGAVSSGVVLGVAAAGAHLYYMTNYSKDEDAVLQTWSDLPLRWSSRVWGKLNSFTVPVPLRKPLYGLYANMFGCKLDEMAEPLESYPTLGHFFTRSLKPGTRTWLPDGLVSPVDARVMVFGDVEADGTLEQIKGRSYPVDKFLGFVPQVAEGNKLCHIVLYLAPGDYHGFHAPVDWHVTQRSHVPGVILPVAPAVVRRVKHLFAVNERIVLSGYWAHGFFSMTPVAATNVGNIELQNLNGDAPATNVSNAVLHVADTRVYDKPIAAKRGSVLGFFKLGSTVVLVFEAPADWQWNVQEYQPIRMGERLGSTSVVPITE